MQQNRTLWTPNPVAQVPVRAAGRQNVDDAVTGGEGGGERTWKKVEKDEQSASCKIRAPRLIPQDHTWERRDDGVDGCGWAKYHVFRCRGAGPWGDHIDRSGWGIEMTTRVSSGVFARSSTAAQFWPELFARFEIIFSENMWTVPMVALLFASSNSTFVSVEPLLSKSRRVLSFLRWERSQPSVGFTTAGFWKPILRL